MSSSLSVISSLPWKYSLPFTSLTRSKFLPFLSSWDFKYTLPERFVITTTLPRSVGNTPSMIFFTSLQSFAPVDLSTALPSTICIISSFSVLTPASAKSGLITSCTILTASSSCKSFAIGTSAP